MTAKFKTFNYNTLPALKILPNSEYSNLIMYDPDWERWVVARGGTAGTHILVFPDEETRILFLLKFSEERV